MIANQNKMTKGKIIEKPGFNPIKLQETKQMEKKETKGKGIELPGCIPTKLQWKIETEWVGNWPRLC